MILFTYLIVFMIYNKVNAFKYFEVINNFKHITDEINALSKYQSRNLPPQWIEQYLDHFDPKESKKWKMKYYKNLKFWKNDGPIYIFIGGEGPLSPGYLRTGLMFDLAKETNGAMFAFEHRYYGDSKPVNITNADDFEFLTARQALADVATLIQNIKSKSSFNSSKVIVVGGSYAGNLAAWMRELYPNLVDAALASSAPVLAKKDFYEYLEKVKEDYENYGSDDCLDVIAKKFNKYEKLLGTSEGIKILKEEEYICDDCDMEIPENQQVFFAYMVSDFMYNAQYGNTDKIKNHCNKIDNSTKKIATEDIHWQRNDDCYDYSFKFLIEAYKLKEYDWALAWTYQTCTEYGYFQTANSDFQPFTKNIPLSLYISICKSLFGKKFNEARVDEGVLHINDLYGGLNPNITNVVFSNGELDPWSMLSVVEDISYDTPAVRLPRSSHCKDLYPENKNDPEEVKEARNHLKYLIKSWIGIEDYDIK